MAITTAPVLVAKPTPSAPLRYGIFQAANGPLELPAHARTGGLRYVNTVCAGGHGYEVACAPPHVAKTFDATSQTVLGAPFVVYATLTCGTVGYTHAELQGMTVEKLRTVEQSVVEQVFSTGTFGASPALLNPGVTTVAGGGVTVGEVLSELERGLYCTSQYGVAGTLHTTIPVFNALKEATLIDLVGGRWVTGMGTVVSTGCYAGNSPDGVVPVDGTFWMYLTGQTTIWRDSDSNLLVAPVEGTLNRVTNQQTMIAERFYVVTYECAAYAKAVTLWP